MRRLSLKSFLILTSPSCVVPVDLLICYWGLIILVSIQRRNSSQMVTISASCAVILVIVVQGFHLQLHEGTQKDIQVGFSVRIVTSHHVVLHALHPKFNPMLPIVNRCKDPSEVVLPMPMLLLMANMVMPRLTISSLVCVGQRQFPVLTGLLLSHLMSFLLR